MKIRHIIVVLLCVMITIPLSAQFKPNWNLSMSGYAGSRDSLSFWAVANRHGIVPSTTSGVFTFGINSGGLKRFKGGKSDFKLAYGATFVGQFYSLKSLYVDVDPSNDQLIPNRKNALDVLTDQLYISGGWKKLRIDLGIKYRGTGSDWSVDQNGDYIGDFNGIGLSNGSVVMSGNGRNFLGYGISLEPVAIPWTAKRVWIWGNFGDYQMRDGSYIYDPMLHNQAFYLKINITRRLDLTAGFDHWAMWGGANSDGAHNPHGFNNYIRVILCKQGAEDANRSDQINVIGNHLGRTLARLTYSAENYKVSLSKDSPYEDASGLRWQNFPDGVWSLYFSYKEKNRWVSDIIYEYIYTKWQSGPAHDRPATEEEKAKQDPEAWDYGKIILGGGDNYFSHGNYRKGWTNYGRMMGLPLISLNNNRISGHHFGIKGKINKVAPYRLMVTYSQNYGKYYQTDKMYNAAPRQVSFAFDGELPQWGRLPFVVTYGLYFDKGELYRDNVCGTIGLKFVPHRGDSDK